MLLLLCLSTHLYLLQSSVFYNLGPCLYAASCFCDPRAVDVWACGVIYMAMRTGRHLWRVAQKGEDEFFTRYLEDRKEESGFRPIVL